MLNSKTYQLGSNRSVWVIPLLMLSSAAFVSYPMPAQGACQSEIYAATKTLREQAASLRAKVLLSKRTGPQVEVGSCATRLNKLFGPFPELCCTDYKSVVATLEEIACLELKMAQLKRSCDCADHGGYSFDEAVQDQTIELWAAVRLARDKAIARGIKNPIIRATVKEATKAYECIHDGSIAILRGALKTLEAHLANDVNQ